MLRNPLHNNLFLFTFAATIAVILTVSVGMFIRKDECGQLRAETEEYKEMLSRITNYNDVRDIISVQGQMHLDSMLVEVNTATNRYYKYGRRQNRMYLCGMKDFNRY